MKIYFEPKFVALMTALENEDVVNDVIEYCRCTLDGTESYYEDVMKAGEVFEKYNKELDINISKEAMSYAIDAWYEFEDGDGVSYTDEFAYCLEQLEFDGVIYLINERTIDDNDSYCQLVSCFLSELEDEGYYKDTLDKSEATQLAIYLRSINANDDMVAEFVHDVVAYKNISQHPNAHCYSGLVLTDSEAIDNEFNLNPDNPDWLEEVVRFIDSDVVIAVQHCG